MDGSLLKFLASNISAHKEQLQELGGCKIKEQLKLSKEVTEWSSSGVTILQQTTTHKLHINSKELSKEQRALYLFRQAGAILTLYNNPIADIYYDLLSRR